MYSISIYSSDCPVRYSQHIFTSGEIDIVFITKVTTTGFLGTNPAENHQITVMSNVDKYS